MILYFVFVLNFYYEFVFMMNGPNFQQFKYTQTKSKNVCHHVILSINKIRKKIKHSMFVISVSCPVSEKLIKSNLFFHSSRIVYALHVSSKIIMPLGYLYF